MDTGDAGLSAPTPFLVLAHSSPPAISRCQQHDFSTSPVSPYHIWLILGMGCPRSILHAVPRRSSDVGSSYMAKNKTHEQHPWVFLSAGQPRCIAHLQTGSAVTNNKPQCSLEMYIQPGLCQLDAAPVSLLSNRAWLAS